jgi:hypothetical protein
LLKKSAEAWATKNGGRVIGYDAARKAPGQASL